MRSKLKILMINTSASHGGAAAVATSLHNQLNTMQEVESKFISGRNTGMINTQSFNVSKPVYWGNVLMYRALGMEAPLNIRAWGNMYEHYINWADIIHLHNVHGYYLPIKILKNILTRKVVWTLHDYWLLTGRCAIPVECMGYKDGCNRCLFKKYYPSSWFDNAKKGFLIRRQLIERSKAIFVTPSNFSRHVVVEMGMPPGRVVSIENPLVNFPVDFIITDKMTVRNQIKLPNNKKIILFVSNTVDDPKKGFHVLIAAMNKLCDAAEWLLVVIGAASRKIKKQHRNLKFDIIFTGSILDKATILRYFMAVDVFVNPSYSETFGLVNIESLAAGCPVICSDLQVFKEVEIDSIIFFNTGDADHLARTLMKYGDKISKLFDRMELSEIVKKRYSISTAGSRYVDLYKKCML